MAVRRARPQDVSRGWPLSQADFAVCRDGARTLERLAAYKRIGCNVRGNREAARDQAARVSAEFFDVLGVPPLLGRTFRPGDDAPGRPRLGVVSFAEWQGRLGGDPGVLGQSLLVDGVPVEIVGVMPSGFAFPDAGVQLWISLALNRELTSPYDLVGIGRLAVGVRPATAQLETTEILDRVAGDAKDGSAPRTIVTPLQETIVGGSRSSLLILLGSVTLVLLIACANVTNMLLVRSVERDREIALRFALGATRGRIVRQLLTECLLLGAIGGAGGLAVAAMALQAIAAVSPLPRLEELRILTPMQLRRPRGMVRQPLIPVRQPCRHGVCIVGIARNERTQAWRVHRAHAAPATGARMTRSLGSRRANGAFVIVQIALSLVLLVGTGLLLRSLHRIMDEDPGFDTRNLLALNFEVPPRPSSEDASTSTSDSDEASNLEAFAHGIAESVRGLAGIRSAGLASALPFTGFDFAQGDTLLFGQESAGVPDSVHDAAQARLYIPLAPGARSLNVVTAAAMAVAEALRQTGGFPSPPQLG